MAYYKCGSIHPTQNSNVVVDNASGAIANFNTPLSLPLIETKFGVKATQEAGTPTPQSPKAITGVSAVNVYNRGSNLFDISTKTDGVFLVWSRGDTYNDAKSIASDYIEVKEGVKFTSNYMAQWCCYDKNKNYLGNILSGALITTSGDDRTDNTIPSGYGVYYLRLGFRSALNNNEDMTEKTDIVLSVGNRALSFEAYNGSTTLINLGGTYYGGEFTQDKNGKRAFKVTHDIITLNGSQDIALVNWQPKTNTVGWVYPYSLTNNKTVTASTLPDVLCNKLEVKKYGQLYENDIEGVGVLSSTAYGLVIRIAEPTLTTKQAINDYLTSNPIVVVYELAEPYTIDLTDGEPIKSLPGVNNIFCDTGDTSLQFRKIG